jgi:hypothetical protein
MKNFDAYTKMLPEVAELLAESMVEIRFQGTYNSQSERDAYLPGLAEFLGITYSKDTGDLTWKEFNDLKIREPLRTAALEAYYWMDEGKFWHESWNMDKRKYEVVWKENKALEKLIKCLVTLGYQESQEEISIRRGSHELFKRDSE